MSERREKFTQGPLCWVRCENHPDGGPSGGITIWAESRCECGMHEDFCTCDIAPTLIEDGDASELSDADAALFSAAPEMYCDGIRVSKAADRVRFQLDRLLADLNRYPHLKAYGTSVAQAMNELGEELTAAHATRAKARGES